LASKSDKYGNVEWNKTYAEAGMKVARTLQAPLMGVCPAGYTWSFEPNGYYLVKTDGSGILQWSKSYESNYGAGGVIQTSDGGFLLVGTDGPA